MRLKNISAFFLGLIIFVACTEEEPVPQPQVGLAVTNFETTIDENPQNGQIIGTIQVSGAEGNPVFTLNNIVPMGAISIDSNTGQLTVADSAVFDFEVNTQVTAEAKIDDDNNSVVGSVLINIRNVNESGPLTIWDGPEITFTKADGADPALAQNQDQISASVALTRGNNGGQIYNAVSESSSNKANSPAGTKWAVGSIDNVESLVFENFRDAVGSPKSVVGRSLVLYLEAEDVYIPVSFTAWSQGKAGGFAYTRATEGN